MKFTYEGTFKVGGSSSEVYRTNYDKIFGKAPPAGPSDSPSTDSDSVLPPGDLANPG